MAVIAAWTAAMMGALFYVLKAARRLRVPVDQELAGLGGCEREGLCVGGLWGVGCVKVCGCSKGEREAVRVPVDQELAGLGGWGGEGLCVYCNVVVVCVCVHVGGEAEGLLVD